MSTLKVRTDAQNLIQEIEALLAMPSDGGGLVSIAERIVDISKRYSQAEMLSALVQQTADLRRYKSTCEALGLRR